MPVTGMRTLNVGEQGWDVSSELLKGRVQRWAQSVGEHEVEQLVHVLSERRSNRLCQHADALEDRVFRWRTLASMRANGSARRVEIKRQLLTLVRVNPP